MNTSSCEIYDFAGIGLGPFNLGLACLTDTLSDVKSVFFEQRGEFNWHPGMMLESTHMQTPFMSDLVTLADPAHPLSFLSYIKQQGRIYSFYIREDFFLARREYHQYCQWATEQVSNIRFRHCVTDVRFDKEKDLYEITAQLDDGSVTTTLARKLVLGTGPVPYIPECTEDLTGPVIHSSCYLHRKKELQKQPSITIVGSGQSAAEIYHDLLQEIDEHEYELNWVTRSPRFFPLEYSKLTLEMTSPEYVDYFYNLPASKRDELITKQKHLYKGINQSLINDIYDLLYVKRLKSDLTTHLLTNTTLCDAEDSPAGIKLKLRHDEQGQTYSLDTSALVLATGYRYQLPDFLEGLRGQIRWDKQGRFDVARNYAIDKDNSRLFVQNAELHTHGFVSPDLGMACYRNSYLIKEITGTEYYPIEQRIAFQQFGAPEEGGAEIKSVLASSPEDVFSL